MMFSRARRRQTMKKVALGSTLAAAAGYVAGILTAPKSGKQTRKDIKKAADKGLAAGEQELKKLHTDLDGVIKDAKATGTKAGAKGKQELDELVAKAKKAKEKTRRVISDLREGSASDEDLAKAVKQAKHSLANLKTYLKK